jgi:hypothetical protein
VAQYTQLCRLTVPWSLKWLFQTNQWNQEKIPFHHICAKTSHKIPFSCLNRPHSLRGAVCTVSASHAANCDENQSHGNIALHTSLNMCGLWHCRNTFIVSWTARSSRSALVDILHCPVSLKLITQPRTCYSCWPWFPDSFVKHVSALTTFFVFQ